MGERWRTNAHTPGRAMHGAAQSEINGDLDRYGVIRGTLVVEEEVAPLRSDETRYCTECGTVVCSYKDPHLSKVMCYAHDHLTPWTRPYLMGQSSLTPSKKQRPRGVVGRGRRTNP